MVWIKIWVDDLRPMPDDYDFHYVSVYQFIRGFNTITPKHCDEFGYIIDLDHDAGYYSDFGGDYINILKFLYYYDNNNENNIDGFVRDKCIFKFHTANCVGMENMVNFCNSHGWKIEK